MQKHFRSASLRAVSYTLSVFAAIGIFGATAINAQEATSPKRILDFEGNKIFSKQELLEVANKCLDGYSKSENQDEVLDYCLHRVRKFLSARGYLQAQLGKPPEEQSEGVLKTIVTVKEGAQFRLGEVKVSGATTLTSEQVLGMFDLKAGDIAASDKIAEWVYERVKKSYGKFGYITYTGEVTPPDLHVKDGRRGEGSRLAISDDRRWSLFKNDLLPHERSSLKETWEYLIHLKKRVAALTSLLRP